MKTILLLLFIGISMAALAQDTTVTQIEYFFDADNGIANNTLVNVTPASDGTFPFTASIAGLAVGYHKLYIRTKDSNGKWSQTARRNIEVFAAQPKTTIVSGEYFIDTDPGYGAGMPVAVASPDSLLTMQNFTASVAGLAVGYHKLYGRLKDNFGRWSQTFRRNIEVYRNDTNYVYNAEYFFKTDNGYGNCTQVKLANPSVDGTFSFSIPPSQIPTGADTLFVRVQDSTEDKWSLTAIKNISGVLPLTLLSFTVTKQNNTAQLSWQTANEINTSYFTLQRSLDGRNFMDIGKVAAKGSNTINNSYMFVDNINQLLQGKIYYRLQMVDTDGKQSYSIIKMIEVNGAFQITITPNPVISNYAAFHIYSPVNVKMQLAIYNELGALVFREQSVMQAGSINKLVNLSGLAAGMYWVRATDGISQQTLKFSKQ